MDFITTARAKYDSMSKGQKAITDYILANMSEAAFMTAAVLGEKAGVSESTVVRYAGSLGYDGFPEMSRAMSLVVKGQLSAAQRLERSYGSGIRSELLSSVLMADMDRLSDTLEMADKDTFDAAVDLICRARRIYVVGLRQEAPLAGFLAFYLNMIIGKTELVQSTSMSEIFEQLLDVGEKDVVIGLSFPSYSLRTLKAMEFANSKSAQVIAITDGRHSPINIYSSVNLFAKSDPSSVITSMTAPLSLVNALVVGVCMKELPRTEKRIAELEKVWDDFQSYGPDEMEPRGT